MQNLVNRDYSKRARAHTHTHTHTHTHARTHARTRARTHASTHARTHARTGILAIHNLIYTQLKPDSKQRLETDEDSSTDN